MSYILMIALLTGCVAFLIWLACRLRRLRGRIVEAENVQAYLATRITRLEHEAKGRGPLPELGDGQ